MNGYENSVKKILKEHGWVKKRSAKGSHEYWGKEGHNYISVPHGCKSRHTANALMKAADIEHSF